MICKIYANGVASSRYFVICVRGGTDNNSIESIIIIRSPRGGWKVSVGFTGQRTSKLTTHRFGGQRTTKLRWCSFRLPSNMLL